MVLALLGVLAYASYFVGNRVVSKKMFGDVVTPRPGSGITTGKPRVRKSNGGGQDVQVQVLPADNDSSNIKSNDDTPSFSDLQRASKTRSSNMNARSNEKIVRADALPTPGARLGAGNGVGDGDAISEPTPRRRRRRRRRNPDAEARRNRDANTTARASDSNTSNDNSTSTSEVPRAERPRRESSNSGGNDSPVPRAEGSSSGSDSGGDSPVPQPE